MTFLQVEIVGWVSRDFPGWVEVRFTDAHGAVHVFHEKAPVVGVDHAPSDGEIACEVISVAAAVVTITTARPWRIASVDHQDVFDVHRAQLREP